MLVAHISALYFIPDGDKHTINYAEKCRGLEFNGYQKRSGHYKVVMASSIKLAANKLKQQIVNELNRMNLSPEDFQFELVYSDLNENNEFWSVPTIYGGLFDLD